MFSRSAAAINEPRLSICSSTPRPRLRSASRQSVFVKSPDMSIIGTETDDVCDTTVCSQWPESAEWYMRTYSATDIQKYLDPLEHEYDSDLSDIEESE